MAYKKTFGGILAVILGGLGIAGCGTRSGSERGAALHATTRGFHRPPDLAGEVQHYEPITEPGVPIGLGYGVDTNNDAGIPNKCVEGDIEVIPLQEGYLALDASFDQRDLDNYLGSKGEGALSFSRWGLSPRAEFSQKLHEQKFSVQYATVAFNRFQSRVFLPRARSEAWKNASPDEWFKNCGSGYVAAQDFGSLVIIKFALTFEKKTDEQKWGGGGDGRLGSFMKLKATIDKNRGQQATRGILSMSAIQIGGVPEALGKILKASDAGGIVESFTLCAIHEPDSCLQGLRNVENYLAKDFPAQIDPKTPSSGALLVTYPFRYPTSLGANMSPGVAEFVQKARSLLAELYDAELAKLGAVYSGQASGAGDSETITNAISDNLTAIRRTRELCYNTLTYDQCARDTAILVAKCTSTHGPSNGNDSPVPSE